MFVNDRWGLHPSLHLIIGTNRNQNRLAIQRRSQSHQPQPATDTDRADRRCSATVGGAHRRWRGHAGQEAEIKVEAFPFTKYGVIPGSLLHLSQDAVPMEKVGYVYTTRVRMNKHTIDVGNKVVNLTPGMNVSVEIKTGKRRVIEYVLTPLLNGVK